MVSGFHLFGVSNLKHYPFDMMISVILSRLMLLKMIEFKVLVFELDLSSTCASFAVDVTIQT